jgi:hypothetical protein
MTERDCLRNGDWKRINYYPVSVEKLQQASMREAAYLIAPVNIGEDYEYFDEVKKFLIIPEKPKTLEELSQELDEKFDKLIEDTKTKFYGSKIYAESRYERNFDKIFDNFEYAKEHGQFPLKLTIGNLDYSTLTTNSTLSLNTEFRVYNNKEVGYWDIKPNIKVYLERKPNLIVRFFTKLLLDFTWKDK